MSLSGCRKKCEEGSSTWPECQNIDATPPPNYRDIVVWNLHDPSDVFRGAFQTFTQTREQGLSINYKQFSNPYEYEELVISEIAQGKGPDVLAIDPLWLTKYPELFAPIPPDIMVPEQVDEQFFPVVSKHLVKTDPSTQLADIFALPLYIDTLAIYYNAKIFRNQLYKMNKPGETWEEIKEQAFDMTEQDKSIERFRLSTIALGRADNIRLAADIIAMLFLQYGVDLFNDAGDAAVIAEAQGTAGGSGKKYFPGVEAMNLYTGFSDSRYKNYSWNRLITGLYPQLAEIGAFSRGKTAMILGYSTTYKDILATIQGLGKNNVATIIPDDIDTVPAPQLNGLSNDARVALAHFYPLAVSVRSAHRDEAWQLVHYLATNQDFARQYHQQTGKPSALKALNPEQQSKALLGVFARQVPYADLLNVISTEDFEQIFKNAIKELEVQGLEEQVLPTMQLRLQCLLDQTKGEQLDTDCPQV